MNKVDFDNALRKQCMSLPELSDPQIAGVIAGLSDSLTDDELKNVGHIIITGCGDSYVAGIAGAAAFKHYANSFGFKAEAITAINASRYFEYKPQNAARTLVIGISASGGPARVVEALRRANHHGCMTLAVTNNSDSPVAKEAKRKLIVNTPEFPNPNPGLRNYFASIVALYFLAARLGIVLGRADRNSTSNLKDAVIGYANSYAPILESIDCKMFALAQQWKDFTNYDYIGDDLGFVSAYFCGAKMVETAGIMTKTTNSEDWCHVHFFQETPERIGTVFFADINAKNLSRIRETVHQSSGIKRPILFVGNSSESEFALNHPVEFIQVPSAPGGFEFMLPLMNYVPGAILAGYISTLNNEPFFRGGGVWAEEGVGTIRTSSIRII